MYFLRNNKKLFSFLILTLSISSFNISALADEPCDDLWFSRNFYFDQAGYCFGSKLGKHIFDNSNCTNKKPVLEAQVKRRIAQIREVEKDNQCRANTKRARKLNILKLEQRLKLIDQPINMGLESGCYGYLGKDHQPIYNGRSANSKIVGFVNVGDTVEARHDEIDDGNWWFATIKKPHGKTIVGWSDQELFANCKTLAG